MLLIFQVKARITALDKPSLISWIKSISLMMSFSSSQCDRTAHGHNCHVIYLTNVCLSREGTDGIFHFPLIIDSFRAYNSASGTGCWISAWRRMESLRLSLRIASQAVPSSICGEQPEDFEMNGWSSRHRTQDGRTDRIKSTLGWIWRYPFPQPKSQGWAPWVLFWVQDTVASPRQLLVLS